MNTERTSEIYSDIIRRLDKTRRKEHRLALLHGSMVTILSIAFLFLSVAVLEKIFLFGTIGRTILFIITLGGIMSVIAWYIVRPLLHAVNILPSADNETIARKIGRHFPSIRDRLLDALQMYEQRQNLQQYYSLSLIDASFSDLYRNLQQIDFSDAISDARVSKMRKITLYAFGVSLFVFVLSPSGFLGSLYRIANFHQVFAAPIPIQFLLEPGNTEVIRGQDVPVIIRTEGRSVKNISFATRQQGQLEFGNQPLIAGFDGLFRTTIGSIKSTTEYFASCDEIKSATFTITVFDRPFIRSFRCTVHAPLYTRMPPKIQDENIGDIDAYPGSGIEIQLLSSKELSSSAIIFGDSSMIELKTAGAEATGSFTVKYNATYHLLVKDRNGLSNNDPVEYTIKIIPDAFPVVEILSPGKNIDVTEEKKLDLFLRARDDFGCSSLRLAYRLANSRYEKPSEEFRFINIPMAQKDQQQFDIWYHWDITDLHLVPEDVVAYYVEVFDNDNVSGPKSGRSEVFTLRLPSLEEVFSEVEQRHDESMESIQKIASEAQELKKEMEELHRDMKTNREKMDWQQQKKAEEMVQRYDAMKKKLEEAAQKVNEMVNKMAENNLLSPKTMEKYQELQKLMEKLNTPEFRDALKKLQESMKQSSPNQMQQSMEQMKLTEEQFRESLERTIELLKRIHIEQKLDELIKRADEMAKQQKSLKEQSSKTDPSDEQTRNDLAKQQSDLQKQMEKLEAETAALKERMEEFPKEMPLDEMKRAEDQLKKNQTGKKMQSSAMNLQSGNMQNVTQDQQQSEEDLAEYKKQMEQVQKALQDVQMQQIVKEMRRQLENLLELSKREETMKDESKITDANSQRFRENAQKQNDAMTDLANVADKLGELGKKTFAISPELGKEIGNAMRQMADAMKQMNIRNPGGTSQKQTEAMGSLNRASMMMDGALGNMMQGGKGGMGMAGLMSRLQQAAGAQGGVNAGTQQAMQLGQGENGQLTPQQQAEYQRLGNAQGGVQKSVEELAREAKNNGESSRLLGDLEQIANDMKEVQSNLEQGNVNPNTLQRQEKILSRLLESTKSMRERDYENRRRAEAGNNISRATPAEIDLSTQEGRDKLREELQKIREGRYTKDYEELIKNYFEQLEREKIEN